jgi:hypothetical protein
VLGEVVAIVVDGVAADTLSLLASTGDIEHLVSDQPELRPETFNVNHAASGSAFVDGDDS